MSPKDKLKAQEEGKLIQERITTARNARGRHYVKPEELEDFNARLKDIREQLRVPDAPAMPLLSTNKSLGATQALGEPGQLVAERHQENVSMAGFVSSEWFLMVHTPLDIPKAKQIPDAANALEKEWEKFS